MLQREDQRRILARLPAMLVRDTCLSDADAARRSSALWLTPRLVESHDADGVGDYGEEIAEIERQAKITAYHAEPDC